jgi:hypothetical protein
VLPHCVSASMHRHTRKPRMHSNWIISPSILSRLHLLLKLTKVCKIHTSELNSTTRSLLLGKELSGTASSCGSVAPSPFGGKSKAFLAALIKRINLHSSSRSKSRLKRTDNVQGDGCDALRTYFMQPVFPTCIYSLRTLIGPLYPHGVTAVCRNHSTPMLTGIHV